MTVLPTSSAPAGASKTPEKSVSQMRVRPATKGDADWIEQLQADCFGPGRFARAAFRVRERFEIDPSLSLIAELDGKPVSSVAMTPISLSGFNGYLLGPLATDPKYRGLGAGRLLVEEVSKLALQRGPGVFVILVGDASYYAPMGFLPVVGPIQFPGPVDPKRILVYSTEADYTARLQGEISVFAA